MRNCLTLLAFLTSTILTSQTQKGNWFFENTLGNFYTNNSEWNQLYNGKTYTFNNKSSQLGMDLNTGYLVHKKLAIGAGLFANYEQSSYTGYSQTGSKIGEGSFKSCELLGVPFLRYYFNPGAKSNFYAQVGAGGGGYVFYKGASTEYYESGQVYTKYDHQFSDHHIFVVQVFLGVYHFLNDNVTFNTGVGFNYAKVEYDDEVSSNYPIVTNSSTQLFTHSSKQKILLWRFGFTIYLVKKKEAKKEIPA